MRHIATHKYEPPAGSSFETGDLEPLAAPKSQQIPLRFVLRGPRGLSADCDNLLDVTAEVIALSYSELRTSEVFFCAIRCPLDRRYRLSRYPNCIKLKPTVRSSPRFRSIAERAADRASGYMKGKATTGWADAGELISRLAKRKTRDADEVH
jgi:hypothetical protein